MTIFIKIAMIIFIALLLFLAQYLFSHRHKNFLIFKPETAPGISQIMLITSILLLIICLAGIIILFFEDLKLNLITLVAGSLVVASFALAIAICSNRH